MTSLPSKVKAELIPSLLPHTNQDFKLNNRISFIDSLRGIGLLGLAIIHFLHWHTSGPLLQDIQDLLLSNGVDKIIYKIAKFFISYKFFAIFSFVFGLSFYLQISKKFSIPDFTMRIILLLIFGIIHHILWRGDILLIYAPIAVILCLLKDIRNNILLIISLFCILNIPGHVINYINGLNLSDSLAIQYHIILKEGSLLDIIIFNLNTTIDKFHFQIKSGRLFITLGYFLLGMYVGRKNWHRLQLEDKSIILKIAVISLIIFIVSLGIQIINKSSIVTQFINISLTFIYISTIALAYYNNKFKLLLNVFAPVGRMSLTNYISQTIFGLLIFYSIGLGLYGKTTSLENLLIAISVFVFQLFISHIWLRYFNYGILEWIWRCAYKMKYHKLTKD